jgi:hypothetical protein
MSTNDPDQMLTEQDLDRLQLTTLEYYLHELNPANGLIRDKTEKSAPASIAAVGLALAALPILVERGVVAREFAPQVALITLRFFRDSPHGPEPDATGYKGLYYHFLDMKSGRRAWNCELSTIDSAFLFAGMLTCAAYFDADTAEEGEVRRLAAEVYARADWQWALNGGPALSHGWRAESGFVPALLEGLRRSASGLLSRPRLAKLPASIRKLCGVLFNLSVARTLRTRSPLLRPTVYASAFPPLDRFSRYPRQVHARAQYGLFRKQPAGNVCPPSLRN